MEDIKIVGLSPKKTSSPNRKVISAIIGVIVLSIGVIAGILLVRQKQDLREKAGVLENCPGSEICSGVTQIMDCSEGGLDPNVSDCNRAGRIEMCGGQETCCPSSGGKWTLDLTKCSGSGVTGGNCETPATIVKCPAPDGNLYSCNPPDQNNNAQISTCNVAGRRELCGVDTNVVEYCCPAPGGTWTTDMTACDCDAKAPTGLITQNLDSTSVTLKWTGATGGKLRLWVSKDPDPTGTCSTTSTTCVVNDLSITPITTTEHVLTNLAPNTKYYWRIMAWTKSGCDSGSAVMNFTTTSGSSPTATATATATATSTSSGSSNKTATPTATSKSTTTAKATSTSKATSTAKATTSGTAFPVPETGAEWPTILGTGFGIIMLLVSLALAL